MQTSPHLAEFSSPKTLPSPRSLHDSRIPLYTPQWRPEDSLHWTQPWGQQTSPYGPSRPPSAPIGGHSRSPAPAGGRANDPDTPPTPRQEQTDTRCRAPAASDPFNPFDEEVVRVSSWSRTAVGLNDESPNYPADSESDKRNPARSRALSGPDTNVEDGESASSMCRIIRGTVPAAREAAPPPREPLAPARKIIERTYEKPNTDSRNNHKTRNSARLSPSVDSRAPAGKRYQDWPRAPSVSAGRSTASAPLRHGKTATSALPAAAARHELSRTRSQSAARRVNSQTKESALRR